MTDAQPNDQEEAEPTSTADIITHTAIMIAALSEIIGRLEFIQDDAEEGEDNPLSEEDQAFLADANAAIDVAIDEIGHGNDISRSCAMSVMNALMDRYAGEEHICDDCRAKAH